MELPCVQSYIEALCTTWLKIDLKIKIIRNQKHFDVSGWILGKPYTEHHDVIPYIKYISPTFFKIHQEIDFIRDQESLDVCMWILRNVVQKA